MGKLSKDKRDIYYRLAKENNWRARSVFKLLQIDESLGLFTENRKRVVDLCAAPGSWCQAIVHSMNEKKVDGYTVVAVDLQEMSPIPGVTTIVGDITMKSTVEDILSKFNNELVDIVVCDGASDVTGIYHIDDISHDAIFTAAFGISRMLLRSDGIFLIKIFTGRFLYSWIRLVKGFFKRIVIAKPSASRLSSREAFLVCLGYQINMEKEFPINALTTSDILVNTPEDSVTLQNDLGKFPTIYPTTAENDSDDEQLKFVEFIFCKSANGYDGDTSYSLDKNSHVSLNPVQPPTNPPYKYAVDLKRGIHFQNASESICEYVDNSMFPFN